MVIYVTDSDRRELTEELAKEGVAYQERSTETIREMNTASWRRVEVQANLPEVLPVPGEYAESDGDVRAWRLPSGRLIITDMEGNLDRIATPRPAYGK